MLRDKPAFREDKKHRLGRGLDSLLGPFKDEDSLLFLDIEKIQPNKDQPRKVFDKEALEKLSASMKSQGVLQPILVKKYKDKYQIIAGERRWRAAALAGLHKIPVILKKENSTKEFFWALIENLQREDLNPMEEARAYKKIMEEQNLSQEFLAKSLGKSRSSVANTVRLLQLDEQVQKWIEEKALSFSQAREILSLKSHKKQREMASICVKRTLTVKKLSLKTGKNLTEEKPFWLKQVLSQLEKNFSQSLALKYKKGKGQLSFFFRDEKELKSLLHRLLEKESL